MTTPLRENLHQDIPEGGTATLSFEIVDDQGAQVPLASLQSLKLTLYDENTGSAVDGPYINLRNAQSILNANGGTVTEAGGLTKAVLKLSGNDNQIVTPLKRFERHVAFLEWTWSGGAGPGRKEFGMRVKNLSRV